MGVPIGVGFTPGGDEIPESIADVRRRVGDIDATRGTPKSAGIGRRPW
jgi:hypothetical protein